MMTLNEIQQKLGCNFHMACAVKELMAESSFAAAPLLADLVAKYLASDGSSGLYDARTMRTTRDEIMKIVPASKVRIEKMRITKSMVG